MTPGEVDYYGVDELLTDEERHQLLVEWNDTKKDLPDRRLHQLVEEQAERTPDAVAVSFEGKTLKYHELDRRANQLAHKLMALGVGPNVLVGICAERSLEMVVGLLGILKASGAYVPLFSSVWAERRLGERLARSAAARLPRLPGSMASSFWLEKR